MRILVIDCLFLSNKANSIGGGAQLFTRNQMDLLSSIHDMHYIIAVNSDKIYENQYILSNKFDITLLKKDKIKQNKIS